MTSGNGFVMTDNNSGPNNPTGTSYSTCSTVKTLSGIISSGQTLPQCLADGSQIGWTESWPRGSATGTLTGPAPETASHTAFSPSNTGVNCPPSQAEIAAGAVPDTCVFAVSEIDWYYYCVFGICLPDFGNAAYPYPNGENTVAANYLASTFTYQQTTPATTAVSPSTTVTGDTVNVSGSGWGPATGLSSGAGTLTGKICGLGGAIGTCSSNSTVTVSETGGTLTGTAVIGSDIGTQCTGDTCLIFLTSPNTQIENGWIGPQTFTSLSFTVLGPPGATISTSTASVGSTLTITGTNFDPAGGAVSWYLKNTTSGATYPTAACPVPGMPQPQGTTGHSTVGPGGSFTGSILLNLCIVPAFAGGNIEAVVNQTTAASHALSATSGTASLQGNVSENENTPTFDQAVLAHQPLGFWPMGDGTGSTSAADSSGNFNGGTYQGGAAPGQPGPLAGPSPDTAAAFNGTSSYVSTAEQFVDPQTFSLGIWFKTSSPQGVLAGFNNTGNATPTSYDRMLYVGADGHLNYGVYDTVPNVISSVNVVDDGAWHYAVGTFSAGTMALYLDGNLVGTLGGIGALANYTGSWVVGASSATGWPDAPASGYVSGNLADAFTVPMVLGRTDVATQWGFGAAAQPVAGSFDSVYRQAGLNLGATGVWPLSEPSGTTVTDVSGSKLAGTYAGTGVTLGAAGPMTANGDTDTSASFDGSAGLADLPQPLPGAQAAASVGIWFRTTATGEPLVAAQSCAAPCTPATASPLLWVGSNGDLYGNLSQSTGGSVDSGVPVDDGQWHFALVTASATGTDVSLDGLSRATGSATPDLAGETHLVLASFDGTGATWPGLASGPDLYLHGSLAQASLFPTALQATPTALLYSSAMTAYQGAQVTMSPVSLGSASGPTSLGLLEPVGVADTAPTTGGWSVTATFEAPLVNTTPSGNANDNQIPISDLSFAPTVVQAGGATYQGLGTTGVGPTSMSGFQPFQQGVAESICSATGTAVAGSTAGAYANCGAVLELKVPPTVAAGTYSATLQITVS